MSVASDRYTYCTPIRQWHILYLFEIWCWCTFVPSDISIAGERERDVTYISTNIE